MYFSHYAILLTIKSSYFTYNVVGQVCCKYNFVRNAYLDDYMPFLLNLTRYFTFLRFYNILLDYTCYWYNVGSLPEELKHNITFKE